jgi:hypothetical protein
MMESQTKSPYRMLNDTEAVIKLETLLEWQEAHDLIEKAAPGFRAMFAVEIWEELRALAVTAEAVDYFTRRRRQSAIMPPRTPDHAPPLKPVYPDD